MSTPRVFLLLLVLATQVRADIAVLPDGRRIQGTAAVVKGKLTFTPTAKSARVDSFARILFDQAAPYFRAGPAHRLLMPHDQRLSGVFLGMEKNALQMRLACSSRLAVPRSQLVALTHLPGRRALLTGTFDAKQSAWTLAGKPAVTGGDLLLNEKGQSASLTLGTPLAGGWFGIDFESRNTPSGGLWVAELTFADSSDPLRITLAGGEWAVAAKGRTGSANKVKLSTGRHRLTVGFSSSALRVLIDDRVLWYSDKGTGKLKSVRLRCESKGKIKGAVAFATYGLEKSVPEHRRPPAEPGQDELWLAGGDQLFGTVIAADSQGVQLKGKTGTGNHAWATLRGWYGKQPKVAPLPRQMVRLGLHNGVSNDLDWLTGTLVSLDTKKVVFKHGILGELSIDRRWVALIAMN